MTADATATETTPRAMMRARIDAGLTLSGLSELSEVNRTTLHLIESGRLVPYADQLQRIAAALDWKGEPAELLEADPAMTSFTAADKKRAAWAVKRARKARQGVAT